MNKRLYKDVVKWQRNTFPNGTAFSILQHLKKEIEELETAQGMGQVKEELADCFILLFGVVDRMYLNYEGMAAAIKSKLEINKKRDWGAPDNDGVILHIKK